jgi:hypothetical protein
VVRGLGCRLLVTLALACPLESARAAQPPADPYEGLTPAQRAVLPWSSDAARGAYNSAPPSFRRAFEGVTTRLSPLLLWDPENGEVLGSALDLIERVEEPGAQPRSDGQILRLVATLAPGARDRLRRSRDFTRPDSLGTTFVHGDPVAIRIEIGDRSQIAVVTVLEP